MNIFDNYIHSLLSELNSQEVQYLIVGGYAVNFHGFRRTTGDIDLWVKPDNGENKKRLLDCLRNLSVSEKKLKQLDKLDFTKPHVFVDGEEPFKIDFLTKISNVNFEEAWEKRIIAELDGLYIPFLHLNDLVRSKFSTGRPQDKIDIETLQKIQQLKKKK